ncbi:MAG TPA: hypothetical protein VIF37_00830 [Methylobacter sp.]|jgi:hypothetical protein
MRYAHRYAHLPPVSKSPVSKLLLIAGAGNVGHKQHAQLTDWQEQALAV